MVSRSLKEVLKTPHSLRMRREFLKAILLYSTQLTVTITSRVLSMDLLIGSNVKWIILMYTQIPLLA
jgi:hypothetical protein